MLENLEVIEDARRDEHPEDGEELALLEQVGLARVPDDVRDLVHGLVDLERLGLLILHPAVNRPQRTHDNAEIHQRVAAHGVPEEVERHLTQVRQVDVRLASERRQGGKERDEKNPQKPRFIFQHSASCGLWLAGARSLLTRAQTGLFGDVPVSRGKATEGQALFPKPRFLKAQRELSPSACPPHEPRSRRGKEADSFERSSVRLLTSAATKPYRFAALSIAMR